MFSGMSQNLPMNPDTADLLSTQSLIQYAEAGIVSRTLFAGKSLRVVLFAIAKGQELTEHTSTRRAFVQVLGGSCRFLFNGTWTPMRAGDLLHMPPGHSHAVKAETEDCSLLLTLHADDGAPAQAVTESASEANA